MQRTYCRNTLSLEPQSLDLRPQTSLPYIRIGFINTSNRFIMTSNGSFSIALILLVILNEAFCAWSHRNEHVFVSRSCLGSRIELIILPRYLSSFTSSISTELNCTFDFLGLPNTMTFVLISFTIMWLLEQNCFNPWSWICSPWNVSENKIKSFAHNRWTMISSLIHIPYLGDLLFASSQLSWLV